MWPRQYSRVFFSPICLRGEKMFVIPYIPTCKWMVINTNNPTTTGTINTNEEDCEY